MKSEWEYSCEEHQGSMAFWRTMMGFFNTVLTVLITLKVFSLV